MDTTTLTPIYFLDGGLGTTLEEHFGCIFDDSTPLWSSQLLLSPQGTQILEKCHAAFVEAGADLITTATYQASTRGFIECLPSYKKKLMSVEDESVSTEEIEHNKLCQIGHHNSQSNEKSPESSENPSEGDTNRITFNKSELKAAHRYMCNAIKLARSSFGPKKGTVVLGLGAGGACLKPSQEYTGNYVGSEVGTSVTSIRKWHYERLCVFAHGVNGCHMNDSTNMDYDQFLGVGKMGNNSSIWNDVDLVAFETLPLLNEIIAVREAMSEIHHHNPDNLSPSISSTGFDINGIDRKDFWISCVFPGVGYQLPDGSSITEVVRAMLDRRENAEIPTGIGINCTQIGKLEKLIEKYEDAVRIMISNGEIEKWPSLVVYPDGTRGEVYNTTTHKWEMNTNLDSYSYSWDERMYNIISSVQNRGTWKSIIVGGCCKTSPLDIKKLRSRWKFT